MLTGLRTAHRAALSGQRDADATQENVVPHVYIPSAGRARAAGTAKLLVEACIPFTMVVEPCEFDDYRRVYGTAVHMLDCDDQGVSYARNAIVRLAIERKTEWI